MLSKIGHDFFICFRYGLDARGQFVTEVSALQVGSQF